MQNSALFLTLLSAFVLGLRHGIDYDHIAAITDITGIQPDTKRSMFLGLMYAVGHASVILLLGSITVFFGVHLPQGMDVWMERVVGVTLLVLGIYVAVVIIRTTIRGSELHIPSRGSLYITFFYWLRSQLAFRKSPTTSFHQHGFNGKYGPSAFTIGIIHGIGAETPTQLLFFILAAGIGGAGKGFIAIVCFVSGLIVSNTFICALSAGLIGTSAIHKSLYRIIAGTMAVFSVCVGLVFIFGGASLLPPI